MVDPPLAPGDDDENEEPGDGLLDRARDLPVGVLDPNIIGAAGPTDIPPGTDPPTGDEEFPPSEP